MRKVLLILLTLIVSTLINAQTVLTPGDIALIAYQTDNPDRFAFVSLVDISEATEITFTDNSWNGSKLLTGEGNAVWTAPVGGIKKGTVIQIEGTTFTGGGIEIGEATQDDFETGDLSNWSVEAESGNTVAINTDTVFNGTYSTLFNYGGSSDLAKMSIDVSNLESIYFRAYVYISLGFNTAPMAWSNVNFVTFLDGNTHVVRLWGNCSGATGGYKIRNWNVWGNSVGQDPGDILDGITDKLGTWTRLEVGWERGTGSDGWIEVRIDGDSICGLSGIDHTAFNVDSIKIGNLYPFIPASDSYFYIDDIVIDTTDWVGGYAPGGSIASNSMDLNDQGDQIFAYQGSSSNPSFIAGLSSNPWLTNGSFTDPCVTDPATEDPSYLPSTLTNHTTAIDFAPEVDNGYYNIVNNTETKDNLLASYIYNVSNWTTDDAIQTWPSWFFTIYDPVLAELSSFTAKVLKNGGIQLDWRIETEVDNYGFEIERLQDYPASGKKLQEWKKIGFVEGHGNSNSPKVYTFLDDYARYGKYVFRLKQIDNDGDYEYSDIIEVNAGNIPERFVLGQNYPNPFNPTTSIKFALAETEQAELKIFDVLGNEVATLFNGLADGGKIYEVEFSAANLSSGIYFYRLETNNRAVNKKMLLLK